MFDNLWQSLKDNAASTVIVVIILCVVFVLIKKFMHKKEGYGPGVSVSPAPATTGVPTGQAQPATAGTAGTPGTPVATSTSSQTGVDVQTGSIMSGPGFEASEISNPEGAPVSSEQIPANYYYLSDGAGGEMSIQHNLCSKSCCSEQWPTPFKQKYDPYVCANKDKFVPSQIMCNNSFQDTGCACLTKKQAEFMYNRGGNGREWF